MGLNCAYSFIRTLPCVGTALTRFVHLRAISPSRIGLWLINLILGADFFFILFGFEL